MEDITIKKNNIRECIKQRYLEKIKKISNEINQSKVTEYNKNDLCLIDSDLIKDILNNGYYISSNYAYFYNNKEPKIINNLSKKIKRMFGIISKEILLLLYNNYNFNDEDLINNSYYENHHNKIYKIVNDSETFSYYAGYNKLIIISKENSALLILNPIDSIINQNNYVIGIILTSMKDLNMNYELYKKIISNELGIVNKSNKIKKLYNNTILDDSEENYYINENIENILAKIIEYKKDILYKQKNNINILQISVNLYYYENILKLKEKENPFKESQYYYIINNNWLNKFKLSNNYDKICNALKRYDENNKNNDIDYYKLSNYQCTMMNDLQKNEKFEFSYNFSENIKEIMEVEENYNNGFIIHERIIELIFGKQTPYSGDFREKKIKLIGCYIYITDESKLKTINIGTLNENLTFNTIYVIEYKSNTISDVESRNLFNKQIEEYLKLRKCNINKKEKFTATLYGDNNETFGTILIFGQKIEANDQSKLYHKRLITSGNQKEAITIKQKELSEKIIKIQNELKLKDEKLITINNEMDNLKKEKELLKESNEQKEKEIISLKNSKIEEYNDIKKKYEKILDKYNNLENEQKEKEKHLLNERINNENKYQNLEKTLKEKNKENIILNTKIEEIEKSLNEMKLLNDESKAKLINSEESLKEYQNKIKELENKHMKDINILEEKNEKQDNEIKEAENKILLKENEIDNLKNDNIRLKTEIKNKEKELIKANMELNKSSQNVDELKKSIDNLNKVINEKDNHFLEINQKNKNLEKINEQNNNLLNQYKKELENEKNENEQNLKAITNINDNDIKKFQNEITQLNSQLSELKKKFDEKNIENEKLIEELNLKNTKLEENEKIFEKIQLNKSLELQNYQNLENKLKNNEEKLRTRENLINDYESELKKYKSQNYELSKNLENSIKDKEEQINNIIINYDNEIKKLKEESQNMNKKTENANSELIKMKKLNEEFASKNNQFNNIIQIKNNEINYYKKQLEENKANKISESEFQKILELNDELVEKNKKLEIKEKEYMNIINDYKIKEKEFEKMKNEFNNQIKSNNDSEINQLEQRKIELNDEILSLTIKLSELEENIKEKTQEYKTIISKINKVKDEDHPETESYFPPFITPPNIGLNNIGATCFMNSTLQCLSQTKKLTKYFLNPQYKERIIKNNIALKDPNALQLSPLYLELISKLWATDGSKNYSPYNFMNCIQSMNPLFQKGQAGDAKDFIIFVLEQMHSELKKNMKKNVKQLPPLNQYDQKNAMQHFFQDFQEELSIFSDLFFGFNETTNICYNCRNNYSSKGQAFPICYNYGIFNCIIFPLEEVKNMKNNFMLMQNNMRMGFNNNINLSINNNRINLYDCFIYNQKTDKFTGENQNYCNICRKMADSDYTSRIYVSPNILILILNRGKNNMFNVKLDFDLTIDITNFVILKDKPKITYNLYGVITHIGESGPNAHFVASCKSPVDNLWYRFNDGMVYKIDNFQKDVHDFCNPYILFYQKDE